MSEQDNLKLIQENYAAFGRGDLDTFWSNLADDIVWESRYSPRIPFHGIFKGKPEVGRFFGILDESVAIQAFVPKQFLAAGDTVVVIGYEEMLTKSTGVNYRNDWVHVFTLANGKVVQCQASNDVATVEAAFKVDGTN